MRPLTPSSMIAAVALLATAPGCAGTTAARPSPAAEATGQAPTAADATRNAAPPAAGRTLSPDAQRLFDEAVAAGDQQKRLKVPTDWEVIEQRWRAVADAQPIPEAFFNMGVARERRGKLDEAREAYRRALAVDPKFTPALMNLAVLDEPKEPSAALAYWSDLLRRYPEDAVPRVRLAARYQAAGQLDEAAGLAREALLRAPRSLGAYKVLMRVAVQRGQPDLVQLLAVKARKIEEGDPEIEALLGDVLSRQGEEGAAMAQWRKAVSIQGDFLPARYALLGSALRQQQWGTVAEQAQAILGANPSDARVRMVLGIAYRHLGQPEKALAEYDGAERADPRLADVHLARGVLLMKVKEQCEPAAVELRRYVAEAGPAVASDGPAPRLLRECEEIVVASRQAADAAREMQAQSEREAAQKAALANPGATAAPTPAGSASGSAQAGSASARSAAIPASPLGPDGPPKGETKGYSRVPTR